MIREKRVGGNWECCILLIIACVPSRNYIKVYIYVIIQHDGLLNTISLE